MESKKYTKIAKIKFLKYYFLFIIQLLIIVTSQSNEITIKIFGIGELQILNENYPICPKSVFLNNEPIIISSTNYQKITILEGSSTINTITIEFDQTITSLEAIFANMEHLIEVDLSKFDSSSVINMKYMFLNCISLNSIKLSNFNTSFVKDMQGMFFGCSSLVELDLTSFDTSKVIYMDSMFTGCKNLTILNISSFITSNVESMHSMFTGLESLIDLDIRHFDTSKVTLMNGTFFGMKSLTLLDLSNFNTSSVVNMADMFTYDEKLENISLTNFDTSKVTLMGQMFRGCKNLVSLDLSSFDTKNVKDMNIMFFECEKLTSLNLSNFKTPNLESMLYMFYGCSSLLYLDISNMNTSHVTDMSYLFHNCRQLKELNLSNFNVEEVVNMQNMFASCGSLESLDLSNFNPIKVTNMNSLFYFCTGLKYLDLSNFHTNSVINMRSMFGACFSLVSLNLSSFSTSNVVSTEYMFMLCSNLKEIDLSNFDTSSLKNAANMFFSCSNLKYINFKNYNESNDILSIGGILEFVLDNIAFCIDEENNVATKLKAEITKKKCYIIDCSENWKTNQKKIIVENNTCIDNCSDFKYENDDKCYSICPIYATFCQPENEIGTTNIPSTINNNQNSEEFSNFINLTEYGNSDQYIFDSSSLMNENNINYNFLNISGKTNEEIYYKIINEALYQFLLMKEEDIMIEGKDDFIFQIIKTEKEKDILNNNYNINKISNIELGECEYLLKNYYNININSSLIILKFEKIINISTERIIQYEIYSPINITKLNLSICNNMTIKINSPVKLSDELLNIYNDVKNKGYDLFDINSAFYQDICVPYTTLNDTDAMLSDRINYYYHNDEILCQSNCKFSNYSIQSQLLKCECDITNGEIKIKESKKFQAKILYESFYDSLKFSNYKVLICHKLTFSINSITKNIGSIISITFFCVYLLFLIMYYFKGINLLKTEFSEEMINHKEDINKEIINIKEDKDNIDIKKEIKDELTIKKVKKQKKLNVKTKSSKALKTKKSSKKNIIFSNSPPKKNIKKTKFSLDRNKSTATLTKNVEIFSKQMSNKNLIINNKINSSISILDNNSNRNNNANKNNNNELSKINEINQKENLDNYELNNLSFNKAIELDKRTFITIYWSVLKREHLIIFTFFIRNDHNIIYIKLCRFIFLVCTDMALNVFFFSDETMHKMFLDYGKYNFIQQIPQIIYSKIISQLIEVFLCFLSMTDKYYYEIKNLENDHKNRIFKITKCIKIKLTFFFVFTLFMFLFNWYVITCFCAVYVNSQIAFIKDSISSFVLGILSPFIIYSIPVSLRVISLRLQKYNLSFLYKLSDIIPFF